MHQWPHGTKLGFPCQGAIRVTARTLPSAAQVWGQTCVHTEVGGVGRLQCSVGIKPRERAPQGGRELPGTGVWKERPPSPREVLGSAHSAFGFYGSRVGREDGSSLIYSYRGHRTVTARQHTRPQGSSDPQARPQPPVPPTPPTISHGDPAHFLLSPQQKQWSRLRGWGVYATLLLSACHVCPAAIVSAPLSLDRAGPGGLGHATISFPTPCNLNMLETIFFNSCDHRGIN